MGFRRDADLPEYAPVEAVSCGEPELASLEPVSYEEPAAIAFDEPLEPAVYEPAPFEDVPVSFEEGVLRIEFPEERAYHCDSLDHAGNKGLVKRVLCERLGHEVNVRFALVPKAAGAEAAGRPAAPRKEIQNIKKNPLIQSALEMFKAQVVDVKR